MHVIFNADDFGLSPGVNQGIIDACNHGVVHSATVMIGMTAVEQGIQLLPKAPNLALGVHLRLTAGKPLTCAPSLTDSNGQFIVKEQFWQQAKFDDTELFNEMCCQVEQFIATGVALSHLDSHHHVHMHPYVQPIIVEVAKRYGVPLRGGATLGANPIPYSYHFSDVFYDKNIHVNNIMDVIKQHKKQTDVIEFMCHPAYVDATLKQASSYTQQREMELATLCSQQLKEQLADENVTVSNYSIFY